MLLTFGWQTLSENVQASGLILKPLLGSELAFLKSRGTRASQRLAAYTNRFGLIFSFGNTPALSNRAHALKFTGNLKEIQFPINSNVFPSQKSKGWKGRNLKPLLGSELTLLKSRGTSASQPLSAYTNSFGLALRFRNTPVFAKGDPALRYIGYSLTYRYHFASSKIPTIDPCLPNMTPRGQYWGPLTS